jgi:type II secretion system (T2SS) protein N
MKKRYYILTAVLSYIFFTLGNVPAAKVISLAQKNTKLPIKLYAIHGSLWEGGAEKAVIPGNPPVDNIEWSINPAMLLLAQLNGEVKGSIKSQNITGNISVSALGTISASDIRARIDAPVIQELAQMPLGELGGVFNINITSLEMQSEGLPIVDATVEWKNAKLTFMETVDLGLVNLSVSNGDNNQLIAKLSNTKGQLLIDGKAKIDDKKAYDLNLNITPEKNAGNNIRQSLTLFAKRQSDGRYLVKRKGNLRELGL